MRIRHTPRGVTLIELLVSMAVSAIVLAGIVGVVNAQQKSFYDGHRQRAAQGSARSALLFIEQSLLLAGYGMDAPLAFDFDRYQGPCPDGMGTCPRDSITNSDEVVFYHRNPQYWVPADDRDPVGKAWKITALTTSSVTINARAGDTFPKGQVVQAVCRGGAEYAYFTVSTKAARLPADGDGPLAITLETAVSTNPFLRQDAATGGCFTGGTARLFQIERHRFHVKPVGTDAYLVDDTGVDTNLDGSVTEADEIVLADGIELLQFGYVFGNPLLAARGTTAGTLITFAKAATGGSSASAITTLDFPGTVAAGQSVYEPTSYYDYTASVTPDPARLTDHQANIRSVRVGLVARSPSPDPGQTETPQLTPLLNLNALPGWMDTSSRYARTRLVTMVPIRNMLVRGMNEF